MKFLKSLFELSREIKELKLELAILQKTKVHACEMDDQVSEMKSFLNGINVSIQTRQVVGKSRDTYNDLVINFLTRVRYN